MNFLDQKLQIKLTHTIENITQLQAWMVKSPFFVPTFLAGTSSMHWYIDREE